MEKKEKKVLVPRKERKRRAEEKRRQLYEEFVEFMAAATDRCKLPNGNVDVAAWAREGDEYVNKLIAKSPQDGEMIRQVGRRATEALCKTLDAVGAKRAGYQKGFFAFMVKVIEAEGLSIHPEVNLERMREAIVNAAKAFIKEFPDDEKMIRLCAVSVGQSLKTKVEQFPGPSDLEFAIRVSAKGLGGEGD